MILLKKSDPSEYIHYGPLSFEIMIWSCCQERLETRRVSRLEPSMLRSLMKIVMNLFCLFYFSCEST